MADFFDKIKDGVNKGVATVSTGSKTVIEKTKINSVIKTLEEEKKQLAELMGVKIYNYMQENDGDIPRSDVEGFEAEITKRIAQINEQKVKLEQLDAEMSQIVGNSNVASTLCSCGNSNKPGSKFCALCGKKLL